MYEWTILLLQLLSNSYQEPGSCCAKNAIYLLHTFHFLILHLFTHISVICSQPKQKLSKIQFIKIINKTYPSFHIPWHGGYETISFPVRFHKLPKSFTKKLSSNLRGERDQYIIKSSPPYIHFLKLINFFDMITMLSPIMCPCCST